MRKFVLMLALLFTWASTARADTVISFDNLSDSTILTNQYSGLAFANAIILSAGISLDELEFPPHSGSNVVSDNGGPMSIAFATPVVSVGGYFTYLEQLTIDAFNVQGQLVASLTSAFSNNEALSGVAGSHPNEFLDLSSVSGIAKISISADPGGSSFTLDDLTYTSGGSPAPTPEPGTSFLCLLAFGIVIGVKHCASSAKGETTK